MARVFEIILRRLSPILFIVMTLGLVFSLATDTYAYGLYGNKMVMVSMGDSFSAGEGIPPFYGQKLPLTDKVNTDSWLAHRSQDAWSGKLHFPSREVTMKENQDNLIYEDLEWHFVAVSGALTKHLSDDQRKDYYKYIDAYKERVLSGSKNLPGQLSVFGTIDRNETDYVTVTIGGNDVQFPDLIVKAADPREGSGMSYLIRKDAPGYDHMHINEGFAGGKVLTEMISKLWYNFSKKGGIREDIKKAYFKIAEKAGPQAQIIVAGYPLLLDEDLSGITAGLFTEWEVEYINENVNAFNEELIAIVEECRLQGLNIAFVDVREAFRTHGAYAKDNSFLNSIMLRQKEDLDDTSLTSSYAIHPNIKGSEAYAKCVQETINNIEKAEYDHIGKLGDIFNSNISENHDYYIWDWDDFNYDGKFEAFGLMGRKDGADLRDVSICFIDSDYNYSIIATYDVLHGYLQKKDETLSNVDCGIIDTGYQKFYRIGGANNVPALVFGIKNERDEEDGVGNIETTYKLRYPFVYDGSKTAPFLKGSFGIPTDFGNKYTFTYPNYHYIAYQPELSGKYLEIQQVEFEINDENAVLALWEAENENGIDKLRFDTAQGEFVLVSSEANVEVTDYLNDFSDLANRINVSYSENTVSIGISGEALEVGPFGVHNECKRNLTVYGIKIGDSISSALERLGKDYCVAVWNRESDGAIVCYFNDENINCDFKQRFLRFYLDDSARITQWTVWTYIPESSLENEEFEILRFLDFERENGIYDYHNDIKEQTYGAIKTGNRYAIFDNYIATGEYLNDFTDYEQLEYAYYMRDEDAECLIIKVTDNSGHIYYAIYFIKDDTAFLYDSLESWGGLHSLYYSDNENALVTVGRTSDSFDYIYHGIIGEGIEDAFSIYWQRTFKNGGEYYKYYGYYDNNDASDKELATVPYGDPAPEIYQEYENELKEFEFKSLVG